MNELTEKKRDAGRDRHRVTDRTSGEDAPTMEELRLASDNFLTRVERLHALEEQKRERSSTDLAEMAGVRTST